MDILELGINGDQVAFTRKRDNHLVGVSDERTVLFFTVGELQKCIV